MSAIQVQPDAHVCGVYRLKWGKRRAIICLTNYEALSGCVPSDSDCRQAFNDASAPGDSPANESIRVCWKQSKINQEGAA